MCLIFSTEIFIKERASKSTTVGWVWPDVPSHTQTCLNLSGWLVGQGAAKPHYKIVQNKRLSFKEAKMSFPMHYT